MPLHFYCGDITQSRTDAIVNAANSSLRNYAPHSGGGVCGAIFRAAGHDQMQAACDRIGSCATGQAVITEGFRLSARYVIHTAGPRYRQDDPEQARLLSDCYRNSLELARAHHLKSVTFPLISSGIYGYPAEEALRIAVRTLLDCLNNPDEDMEVRLCLWDAGLLDSAETYRRQWEDYHSEMLGLEWTCRPLIFFPEDEEKMKDMSTKEKIEYIRWLREMGRYRLGAPVSM